MTMRGRSVRYSDGVTEGPVSHRLERFIIEIALE